MKSKKLQIVDQESGEIVEDIKFTGGYHIIYTNLTDAGNLNHIRNLENAKFGDKHWIKNYIYRPIAEKLVQKFKEINHIIPSSILFIEDMDWEKPDSMKPKRHWVARISKANKQLKDMSGYEYILETRNYYTERMRREQIIALIYHELRHIDDFGDIQPHDVEDWSNMVATLGTDWNSTEAKIKNLLEDEIDWKELEPLAKQMNVFNFEDYRDMEAKEG